MNSNPRGIAVIISNEYFVGLKRREGTSCDVKMLKSLFTQLKFSVEDHKDLAADVSLTCSFYSIIALLSATCCALAQILQCAM